MSAQANRALRWLLLALIGVSMLLLNMHTPLMMDDYDYSFSWATGERLAGVSDIIASQAAHYRLWGGRSVVHFLAQLFLYLGKPVFNAANAIVYVLFLLELQMLSARKGAGHDWRPPLIVHLILMLVVPFFGVSFLWLDGACNYLWGTALALVPLLIARSERECGFFDTQGMRALCAVPLCFLAGWTNENTACGVLGALVLLLAWDVYSGRKIRAWRAAAIAAQALGVAVMLLAPGNFARAGESGSRGFVMEMAYRAAVVTYCAVRYAGIPALLLLIAGITAQRKRIELRAVWQCVLLGSAFLSAYALVGSPQISDRSFTGVIALVMAALLTVMQDIKPLPDRRSLRVGVALILAAVCVSAFALEDVKQHEAVWRMQEQKLLAAHEGEAVSIEGVPSASRFTMSIALEESPDEWPNSTLSRYYGVRVSGGEIAAEK